MPDRAAMVATIEAYCEVQCTKDRNGWSALFADVVRHEDPVGFGQIRGRDDVTGAFWQHIVRNDVRIWLTNDVIVCGNEAIAIMACEVGPEENRRRMAPVVDHFVFADDGRLAEVRGFYNLPA